MTEAISIEELREESLEEVRRFRAGQAGGSDGDSEMPPVERVRWYLYGNPEATPEIPKGFVARNAEGAVVGAKLCSPQRFRCGEREFVLIHGGGYYVNPSYRGVGLRLMRAYLALGEHHSHFSTTMNEVSGAIYEAYGGYPIADTDHEMLGVLRWPPVLEEVLARRYGSPALARGLSLAGRLRPRAVRRSPAAGELRELRAEDLEGLALETPPEHREQITALRSPVFLRWRYFEGPDRSRRLFLYDAGSTGRALVGTRLAPRGHRRQIRSLMVLDYWGRLAADAIAAVAGRLAERFAGEADLLVFRGQPAARRRALEGAGFVHRALPRALGVCVDRAKRLPTRSWYMVPADGDMAI